MDATLARWRGRLRRLLLGAPSPRLAVSPLNRDDLFLAHLALYRFAASVLPAGRLLDLGCGTGYGSRLLAERPGVEVVGVDPDLRAVRFSRRGAPPAVRFLRGVAEDARASAPFAGAAVINVLAVVASPERLLDDLLGLLAPAATVVASVPPIADDRSMDRLREAGGGPSLRYVWDWDDLVASRFAAAERYCQLPPAGARLDFGDPRPSRFSPQDFRFERLSASELDRAGGSLSLLFVGRTG